MDANRLIAHRGDNTNYPENTLIAIKEALKAGATSFEFDVQMNADHTLIAFHDADFKRMSGGNTKEVVKVNDEAMSQISIHEPEQFDQQHKPTYVSQIDAVLDLLKQYPKVQAYVEIKDDSLSFWGVDVVMNQLLNKLKGFEKQATIISFNVEALAYTKAHSDIRIGLVFEEYSDAFKAIATELQPDFMICWYRILPKEKVWCGDWKWMVYTVNEVELAKELLKRGDIEFVETDDIQMMLKA